MNLNDIPLRALPPDPWSEGEKIPWSDPAFSVRMLKEHLSQEHDAASRRLPIIDRQVAWIHNHLLSNSPAKILDIGCGPGLYAHRLARLGHECVGIDFSPASIAYARQIADEKGLRCEFVEGDIRSVDFGEGYDLAQFIFGEFNVFHPNAALQILTRCHDALKPGGRILVEAHPREIVKAIGEKGETWSAEPGGLFSAAPHLVLNESFWLEEQSVSVERWYVIETESGVVTRHSATMQGYSQAEYQALFNQAGFHEIVFRASFSEAPEDSFPNLMVVTAHK